MAEPANRAQADLDRLIEVLNRDQPVESLSALLVALRGKISSDGFSGAAIGLDTNIFLKLSRHKIASDIIDYLVTKHTPPLVMPGQVIQEFWNNHHSAIDSLADTLKKDFDKLGQTVKKIEGDHGTFTDEFQTALDNFSSEYGHLYDKSILPKVSAALKSLNERAILSYVPRSKFLECAQIRQNTKTPPGFKDQATNMGDAYVWFDFLAGLDEAKARGDEFSRVIFVTNEKKKDWCTGGIAHPILYAEVQALFGVDFEIWDLERLASKIAEKIKEINDPEEVVMAAAPE